MCIVYDNACQSRDYLNLVDVLEGMCFICACMDVAATQWATMLADQLILVSLLFVAIPTPPFKFTICFLFLVCLLFMVY